MASLIRNLATQKTANFLRAAPVTSQAVRSKAGEWSHLFKPGPWPRTPEERAVAAKKYGLLPEEYEPHPEDDGFGDYPKLPDIGYDSKDPYYPWDNPDLRRNYNEPMHVNQVIYGGDRADPAKKPPIPLHYQLGLFLGVMTSFALIYEYYEKKENRMQRPVCRKQMPFVSKGPHYTFDPL